jgi:hypothetical protein
MPYGHCILDYNREFDYNVGASLCAVFGNGAMLMSSTGVEVTGQVTVPQSLRSGRLLQVFFDGVPDPQIFRVW